MMCVYDFYIRLAVMRQKHQAMIAATANPRTTSAPVSASRSPHRQLDEATQAPPRRPQWTTPIETDTHDDDDDDENTDLEQDLGRYHHLYKHNTKRKKSHQANTRDSDTDPNDRVIAADPFAFIETSSSSQEWSCVGIARLFLGGLGHFLVIDEHVPILATTGEVVGTIRVRLSMEKGMPPPQTSHEMGNAGTHGDASTTVVHCPSGSHTSSSSRHRFHHGQKDPGAAQPLVSLSCVDTDETLIDYYMRNKDDDFDDDKNEDQDDRSGSLNRRHAGQKRMVNINVEIQGCQGLPRECCSNVSVEYQFFRENRVMATEPSASKSQHPVFAQTFRHCVQVTEPFCHYVMTQALAFHVRNNNTHTHTHTLVSLKPSVLSSFGYLYIYMGIWGDHYMYVDVYMYMYICTQPHVVVCVCGKIANTK
jgi:hypothetical protein